jgi:hypothetical protein
MGVTELWVEERMRTVLCHRMRASHSTLHGWAAAAPSYSAVVAVNCRRQQAGASLQSLRVPSAAVCLVHVGMR